MSTNAWAALDAGTRQRPTNPSSTRHCDWRRCGCLLPVRLIVTLRTVRVAAIHLGPTRGGDAAACQQCTRRFVRPSASAQELCAIEVLCAATLDALIQGPPAFLGTWWREPLVG